LPFCFVTDHCKIDSCLTLRKPSVPLQVTKHRLGEQQEKDVCLLEEDNEDCFLALAMTDSAYVTINSNSKTASQVIRAETVN